jgi:hypothetical protein
MIGQPKTQMTMYPRCAYQSGSPVREPGNCASDYMANPWMMQCHPWYVIAPTSPQFMSISCHWTMSSSDVVSHCIPLYSARGAPIFVKTKLQGPGTEFQGVYSPLYVNIGIQCNNPHYGPGYCGVVYRSWLWS